MIIPKAARSMSVVPCRPRIRPVCRSSRTRSQDSAVARPASCTRSAKRPGGGEGRAHRTRGVPRHRLPAHPVRIGSPAARLALHYDPLGIVPDAEHCLGEPFARPQRIDHPVPAAHQRQAALGDGDDQRGILGGAVQRARVPGDGGGVEIAHAARLDHPAAGRSERGERFRFDAVPPGQPAPGDVVSVQGLDRFLPAATHTEIVADLQAFV